ncbi:MAG: carbonic anhydrase family protein [Rhodocyclaceae bacterium]|nr:carbonic anhydrase family protein [Rhodocyclaceae bacterium]
MRTRRSRAARRPTAPTLPALCAGLALILAAAPAQAAKWTAVAGNGKAGGDRIEVDAASLDRSKEGKVRAWHRETYAARRLHDTWAFTYASLKQLTEFQCDKRLAAPKERIYLASDGDTLKRERFDDDDNAVPVIPDTPLEAVFNQACRKPAAKPAPAAAPPAPAEAAAATPPAPSRSRNAKKAAPEPAPPPPPAPPSGPVAWSYEGDTGPAHWSKLSTDYAACGGSRQSPIDIRAPIRADLPSVRFSWQTIPLTITDTGQTIEVSGEGGGHITVEGEEYEFQRFRFRLPAEETVDGKRAAMSVQFEHRSKSGQIAILAVPLVEGKENRLVRQLWTALPLERGKAKTLPGMKIDPGLLIPQKREYHTYVGSLTTPPCTEGVLWLVMKQPVTLSKEQIADFAKIYRNNARPVQPANGRVVKTSR